MGKDYLLDKPIKFQQRQDRWKHNSFSGHCRMAASNMVAIQVSRTASPTAKAKAREIMLELDQLRNLLQERIEDAYT